MAFKKDGVLLEKTYLKDSDIIDNFVGNTLFSTGYNANGQLGDGSSTNKSTPVQTTAGGTNWRSICVSSVNSHMAVIKTNGELWLWGLNDYGQLGRGSGIAPSSSPMQTALTGTNWRQVSCGSDHTVAIKTTGELWIWGANGSYQLGNNSTAHKSTPVQTIAGGTNWKQAACGTSFTAAIKTNGELWTWGLNSQGQLGNNSIATASTPVQVLPGSTNWKQVACGYELTTAIKTDGTLWTWGYKLNGQLGDNTRDLKSTPVQTILAGNNWKQVGVTGSMTYGSVSAITFSDLQ